MNFIKKWIAWILFLGLLIFLTFNKHRRSEIFSYQSVIHADKAGYYIYLPLVLIYGMDVDKLPENIDQKTGEGFHIDKKTRKLQSKYTSGVAIMQAPFFIVGHIISKLSGDDQSGFSAIYYAMINIGSVIYLWLGLLFLFRVLQDKYSMFISVVVTILTLTGTNLYYYGVDETAMSHVYSFFLFSSLIYLATFIGRFARKQVLYGILVGLVCSLIVLIRPTNFFFIILVVFFCLFKIKSNNWVFQPKILIAGVVVGVVIFLPQVLYWKWAYGSFLTYSYGNESFSNWNSPEIIKTWFAPNNGLFSYNPIVLFMLIGAGVMYVKKEAFGKISLLSFLFISYLTASWWTYAFGCGYGARNFVEYYVVLSIPLAYLLTVIKEHKVRVLIYPLLLVCVLFNMEMIYAYDECWFGEGDWDWNYYLGKIGM